MLSFYHGLRVGTDKGLQQSLQCTEGTATDSRSHSDSQVAAGTQSNIHSGSSPQQSNKFIEARHIDLLKTSVVVLVVLNEKDFVSPAATTTCWPVALQLRLSVVPIPTGHPFGQGRSYEQTF